MKKTDDPCSICENYRAEKDFSAKIGASCQICLYGLCWNSDPFIPIIDIKDGYPRICEECKKRLKKLLYESQKEE